MTKIIFVSGTGRSGTHLIGRVLSTNKLINGRIEEPYTFKLITRIASRKDLQTNLVNNILLFLLKIRLRKIIKKSSSIILEKSHPSIWLFEDLVKMIPNSLFIGVYRDVYPTVSSMINHKGVLSWYNKLPQNKKNNFLGITDKNKKQFNGLSIEEKCTLRWLSHKNELFRLKNKYPERFILINYEDFINNMDNNLIHLSDFLNIKNSFIPEKINLKSLNKWKSHLSFDQIQNIDNIISKEKAI